MARAGIDLERVFRRNDAQERRGDYVLYWMQASQREAFNHALEYGAAAANRIGQPLLAVFALTDDYPEANERHYTFMLEGLVQTRQALERRGIQLALRRGRPPEAVAELAAGASLVVTDRGYAAIQRQWREQLAKACRCAVVQVESDIVVPVETASAKQEWSAATFREKLRKHLGKFLQPLRSVSLKRDSLDLRLGGLDIREPGGILRSMNIDRSVGCVSAYRGGANEARKLLRRFISRKLPDYAELRNDPGLDVASHLSPYLHFGQISPVEIALGVREAAAPRANKAAFLEELIVRRELCINFVRYCRRHDVYASLPAWARTTLRRHARDRREDVYTAAQLEQAATDDPYWNAAMREMLLTGYMHNYMRMYWGKRILQWSRSPQQAFRIALALNNKYFLDGRDPNSYANVAWCFGLHDRPWPQRPVFGAVRCMNASGLERKFDMDRYVRRIAATAANARSPARLMK